MLVCLNLIYNNIDLVHKHIVLGGVGRQLMKSDTFRVITTNDSYEKSARPFRSLETLDLLM